MRRRPTPCLHMPPLSNKSASLFTNAHSTRPHGPRLPPMARWRGDLVPRSAARTLCQIWREVTDSTCLYHLFAYCPGALQQEPYVRAATRCFQQ